MELSNLRFCEVCEKGCPRLLTGLGAEGLHEWQSIVSPLQHVRYDKGETIFHEGMPAMGVYIVCTGVVKVMNRNSSGKSQILKLVGPGELLGEESLFGHEVYSTYSQALFPSELKFTERTRFLDFLNKHQPFGLHLMEKLAQEVRTLQDRLLETSYEGCLGRVARILLLVARAHGQTDESGHLQVKFARQDLGQMTGVAQETVIRTLGRFEERGWVTLNNHWITITDPEGLERLVEPVTSAHSVTL